MEAASNHVPRQPVAASQVMSVDGMQRITATRLSENDAEIAFATGAFPWEIADYRSPAEALLLREPLFRLVAGDFELSVTRVEQQPGDLQAEDFRRLFLIEHHLAKLKAGQFDDRPRRALIIYGPRGIPARNPPKQ